MADGPTAFTASQRAVTSSSTALSVETRRGREKRLSKGLTQTGFQVQSEKLERRIAPWELERHVAPLRVERPIPLPYRARPFTPTTQLERPISTTTLERTLTTPDVPQPPGLEADVSIFVPLLRLFFLPSLCSLCSFSDTCFRVCLHCRSHKLATPKSDSCETISFL